MGCHQQAWPQDHVPAAVNAVAVRPAMPSPEPAYLFVAYILACAGMFLTNFVSVYYGFVAQHMGKLASG